MLYAIFAISCNDYAGMKTIKSLTANLKFSKFFLYLLLIVSIGSALYLIGSYDYLLFHVTAELFSIIIASAIFILAWNTKDYSENNILLFLGIIFLFVGVVDFFHTLSYKGMNLLDPHKFYATEFWIAARYLESLSLFIFVSLLKFGYNQFITKIFSF